MPAPQFSSVETNLKLLEGKPFDALLSWLERALRGYEALPFVVPGESPEIPILRRERELSAITRQDIRKATLTLVRRYVKTPQETDDAFVAALLRLATGFDQKEVITDLHLLAADSERFDSLPDGQIKSILFALLDLKAQLATAFWRGLTERLPTASKVIPVTALLRHGPLSAARILPALPEDEAVADNLYVILDQHAANLSPDEIGKLATQILAIAPSCQPEIRKALDEWISGHELEEVHDSLAETTRSMLNSALAAYASRNGQTYTPEPASPRLVA